MKKKIIYTIIITILILGTSTLTKYEEINNLSIISNIEITYKNNKYKIIFQEIVPIQKDSKIKYEYKYTSITSNSINKSFKKIKSYSHKNIYLKKVQNIIINHSNYKKTINSFIKYYNNSNDINRNTNILITKLSIKNIFKIDNNYKYISSVLKNKNISLNDMIKKYKKNKKIKIPLVITNNNELLFKKYLYL